MIKKNLYKINKLYIMVIIIFHDNFNYVYNYNINIFKKLKLI